jgi:hypothetical protein
MRSIWFTIIGVAAWMVLCVCVAPAPLRWHISGMFTEACTCAPPCTCNFGLGASPHNFCYYLLSYAIKTGKYREVKLDGLIIACAKGQAGAVWYIDRRATPPQADALRAIADRIVPIQQGKQASPYEPARTVIPAIITQEVTERGSRMRVEGAGEFDNTFLIGLDGKTPIVVLNNATFNLKRSMKGRTGTLRYSDQFGNSLDFKGTNTNTGEFEFDQDTRKFLGR